MTTVTRLSSPRKPSSLRHYAILTVNGVDLEGIATQVAGGYAFQADGETSRRLVRSRDVNLTLLGRCDLADRQRQADQAAGGFAALVCGSGAGSR